MPFAFLFIIWPLLEIIAFFGVADEAGFLAALGLIILAAIVGVWLLRYQSLQALMSARDSLKVNRLPSQGLFDAACMMGAGILLIVPGFLSDALAILLLLPPLRRKFREVLRKREGMRPSDVIDAEFERVDENYDQITKRNDTNE